MRFKLFFPGIVPFVETLTLPAMFNTIQVPRYPALLATTQQYSIAIQQLNISDTYIGYTMLQTGIPLQLHMEAEHAAFYCLFILKGIQSFRCAGSQWVSVRTGNYFVLEQQQLSLQWNVTAGDHQCLVIAFPVDVFNAALNIYPALQKHQVKHSNLIQPSIMNEDHYDIINRLLGQPFKKIAFSVYDELCKTLMHIILAQLNKSGQVNADDTYFKLAHQLKTLLEQQSLRNLSLSYLAYKTKQSEAHIRKVYYAVYNTSLGTTIRLARLQAAWQLLTNSATPLKQVALRCGYSNTANFANAFKKHFHQTPLQVRRSHS